MELMTLAIFILVYLGMLLGSWPGLAIDRTGIALLGAIAFMELQDLSTAQMASYIDFPSITILFSFMIISAQFYYSGFYTYTIESVQKWNLSPKSLLFVVIFLAALLSALLINDIVCLALAPLVIKACAHKNFNPVPFLLGLACASNIGSALTLIGNPQNLLIGQVLQIPFGQYLLYSCIPCLLGIFLTWFIIFKQTGNHWYLQKVETNFESIPINAWQSLKGIFVLVILLILFFVNEIPRDKISLAAAGFLLLSRRMASQTMLNFIDWQLLVLFIGLFIVNKSLLNTFSVDTFRKILTSYHIDLNSPAWIFLFSTVLSNLVSNVPAVMLLLPLIQGSFEGSLLALTSTLAGNMFLIGSIANLIVVSQAQKHGIHIDWKSHLKVGLPVALMTLLLTALWMYYLSPVAS